MNSHHNFTTHPSIQPLILRSHPYLIAVLGARIRKAGVFILRNNHPLHFGTGIPTNPLSLPLLKMRTSPPSVLDTDTLLMSHAATQIGIYIGRNQAAGSAQYYIFRPSRCLFQLSVSFYTLTTKHLNTISSAERRKKATNLPFKHSSKCISTLSPISPSYS